MREDALTCTRRRGDLAGVVLVPAATRPRRDRPILRAAVRSVARAHRFGRGLQAHNAFEAAAAIAFWAFLSLVPLLVLVGFLVGRFARARGVDALVGPLLDVVPGAADGLIRSEVLRLAGADAATLAPLGVAGYLWTASSGLHNLMDVFETAVRVKRRAWWKQRAIALGWVAMGLAATCVLACALVKTDAMVR
ncbi:MAG: YihY/virulence factor BrkB family protein, partial [Myxococcota bacterium]|nr:YihY/virulence factor BrkB family protein [Myxococcota bacterium]